MPVEPNLAPRAPNTIMVSRSFSDWEEYRGELIKAIDTVGLKAASVGHYELTVAGAIEASLKLIQSSGALTLIIGDKYGSVPGDLHSNPRRLSFAELEFDEAVRLDLPVVAFISSEKPVLTREMSDDELQTTKKLEAFRSKVEASRFVFFFKTVNDFSALAARALNALQTDLKSKSETTRSQEREHAGSVAASSRRSKSPEDPTDAVVPERPLIFISASHEDSEWRSLFEWSLEQYSEHIEWWDDSKLEAGMTWEDEIDSVRSRAKVAVLLLSPDYLNSRNAITEMAILSEHAKSKNRLKLFPIVVRECAWQNVAEIRAVQIWDRGRALERLAQGNLLTEQLQTELQKIANSILKLAGKTTPNKPIFEAEKPSTAEIRRPKSPDFQFSPNAQRVWDEAQRLSSVSERGRVTSSCLLFGFAEAATEERNVARFVRDLMGKTGKYERAFQTFLTDGAEKTHDPTAVDHALGKMSRNVAAVLDYALTVVSVVSPDATAQIHQRHLLAALLNLPGRKGRLKAYKRLKEIGIERGKYLEEFFAFVITLQPQEAGSWRRLLKISETVAEPPRKTVAPFVSGPAGYTAEFCGVGGERPVADHLFVGAYAERLAELIALKETKLPLAIGLFGNWGSGKSHFMNLMDRHLKSLMKQEKERSSDLKQKWCREIVPIYFNAWHYLDTNLWASLVAQIFESLFAHLRPKEGDLQTVQRLLEEASGATARAAEEVGLAKAATEQAKIDLSVAEENRLREQTMVDAMLRSLEQLLPQITSEELQQQVAVVLGGDRAVKTLTDLKAVSKDARTFGSRAKRSWNNLFKQPGRNWRVTWLVVTFLIIPALAVLAATFLPVVRDRFSSFARGIAAIIAGLPPVIGWTGYLLKRGNEQLHRIDGWLARAQAAQERASETPQVKEARLNVTAAVAREEAARSRLAQAESREQQLTEEAGGLHPERRLGRYIEQRAQSADYRGQLGLVSLARRDFQELSNLFADAEALQERVASLQKECSEVAGSADQLRASTGKDENETKTNEEQAQALEKRAEDLAERSKKIEKLSASIDRILLFVDDLDRCQPEKIVEILQAVHLLLAFPLFAVVVGVDQRALRQSLRMQFKGLLSQDGEDRNGDLARKQDAIAERVATPLDYLEKIFHVPFHLPVMGKDGFQNLINSLTEPPRADAQTETDKPNAVVVKREAEEEIAAGKADAPPIVFTIPGDIPPPFRPDVPAVNVPLVMTKEGPVIATEQILGIELIGSVPLQNWEREALRDYHELIQTPRGAKRLLNTYRLVRAGVPKNEWDSFSGGEYRMAMLLLAAAAGYPASAREWFSHLMKSDGATLPAQAEFGNSGDGWGKFRTLYEANIANDDAPPTTSVRTKWIQRVEAFTF